MFVWITVIGGIAAIALVNWYFFGAPQRAVQAEVAAGGLQEVEITVEGGYSPALVRVRQGQPVKLTFDRKEKSPCSDEVVIGAFGIRKFLRPYEKTSVEFTPAQAGSYEFTCGMSMLRGKILVEG